MASDQERVHNAVMKRHKDILNKLERTKSNPWGKLASWAKSFGHVDNPVSIEGPSP